MPTRSHTKRPDRELADRLPFAGYHRIAQSGPHLPYKSTVGDWGFPLMAFVVHSRQIENRLEMSHATPMLDATVLRCAIGLKRARPSLRPASLVAPAKLPDPRTMVLPTAAALALPSSQSALKGSEPTVEPAFELSSRRLPGKRRCRWLGFSTRRAPGEVATEPVSWPSATIIL
jgi:hypothetical protein